MIANLTTTSGTDFRYTFNYLVAPAGAGIDITGCHLQMMVRANVEDETVYVSLTSDANGGIVISNPVGGVFSVNIDRDQLDRLPDGEYVQNLTITWPDGFIDEIWHGSLVHARGPTR